MKYGLPYKGSKNKIIPFLMSQFPKKIHFYDMFAGGGKKAVEKLFIPGHQKDLWERVRPRETLFD